MICKKKLILSTLYTGSCIFCSKQTISHLAIIISVSYRQEIPRYTGSETFRLLAILPGTAQHCSRQRSAVSLHATISTLAWNRALEANCSKLLLRLRRLSSVILQVLARTSYAAAKQLTRTSRLKRSCHLTFQFLSLTRDIDIAILSVRPSVRPSVCS